jgi:hypothetical protein
VDRGGGRARRFTSQADTLRRLIAVVATVAVVVVALATIDEVRSFGTTVLAGAGLIGAVAGLAVDGQSGQIVERTLSYVVVKLSEQRRLVLPTSHFLNTPFKSWTLTRREVVGEVRLELDWTVPVPTTPAPAPAPTTTPAPTPATATATAPAPAPAPRRAPRRRAPAPPGRSDQD